MKSIFLAVPFVFASGLLSRADVVVPKPTYLTVSNLAAFPNYKFTYTEYSSEPTDLKPLKADHSYDIRGELHLFVQGSEGAPQQWQVVHADRDERYMTIAVKDVQQKDNHKIVVVHKDSVSATPPKKASTANEDPETHRSPIAFFALTGFGVCGLVTLARRRKAA